MIRSLDCFSSIGCSSITNVFACGGVLTAMYIIDVSFCYAFHAMYIRKHYHSVDGNVKTAWTLHVHPHGPYIFIQSGT